jgi:hypothetical protein
MHRSELVHSKICVQKNRDRNYDIHQKKLKQIKTSIDNKAPKDYPHLRKNLKKLQTDTGKIISNCFLQSRTI